MTVIADKDKMQFPAISWSIHERTLCLQPVVQSSVIATPQDTRTRQDKIREEGKNKEGKDRWENYQSLHCCSGGNPMTKETRQRHFFLN